MTYNQAARLARALRKARASRGLSMQQLADVAGVNVATVFKIERGELRTPHAYTLQLLGEALGINTYDLFLLAGWLKETQLPPIGAYLRTKYGDLSDADIKELQDHLEQINRGGSVHGPAESEDERDIA